MLILTQDEKERAVNRSYRIGPPYIEPYVAPAEARGEKRGRAEGMAQVAQKMKNAGLPLNEIAEFTDLPAESIKGI